MKIRIPFVLDSGGSWNAVAWGLRDSTPRDSTPDEGEAMEACEEPMEDVVFRAWIEVDVEVPDNATPTIKGTVKGVNDERH